MRYAELKNERVRYIDDTDILPPMASPFRAIEIIGNDPAIGDIWDGNVFSTPDPEPDYKLIDMGQLAELLPDAVILELEDFKANTGAAAAKRKAAARILLIIASARQWDVYGTDYETLMTKLVSNTALTGTQANAITDTLKAS